MSEVHFLDAPVSETDPARVPVALAGESCDECQGVGGWFRYEPALAPAPGLRYLSCLHCRGSGRMALPSA